MKSNIKIFHVTDYVEKETATELCYAQSNGIPVKERIYGTTTAALRPSFLQTINCKNVVFEDFTIRDTPQWAIHPVYCEDVVIRNIHGKGAKTAIQIRGLPEHKLKNITLNNIHLTAQDAFTCSNVEKMNIGNVEIDLAKGENNND